MTDYFHDLDMFGDESFLIPPSFNNPPKDKLVGDHEVRVSGGAEEVVETYPGLVWQGEYNKMFCNYQEQKDFLEYATKKMGRLRSFWFPSFVSDFTLFQDINGAATHCIYVVPNNFDWHFESERYGLYIETVNDRFVWEITDYKSEHQHPFDLLFTKSQIGKTIKKREVLFASLVRYVRFDTDKFAYSMSTPKVGECSYSFIELPNEAKMTKRLVFTDDIDMGHDHDDTFSACVMLGADWWDPLSDSLHSDGDGRQFRTNVNGATFQLETELGTTAIGLIPHDLPYSHHSATSGHPFEHKQPLWATRRREVDVLGAFVGGWGDWEYHEKETPHPDYEHGYWVVSDIDPTKRYRFQFMIAQSPPPKNPGDRLTRYFEPGESSFADPFTGDSWSSSQMNPDLFWDLCGIMLNSEGGIRVFSDTRDKLKVLVLGDSDIAGEVLRVEGDGLGSFFDDTLNFRGSTVVWPKQLADMYEDAQEDVHVSVCSGTYPLSVFMAQTDKMRAGTAPVGLPPSLHSQGDLLAKYNKLTNNRTLKPGWVPDIVIFAYTATDQTVASFVNDLYALGQAQTQMTNLLSDMRAEWEDVHIFVTPFPRPDGNVPDNVWNGTEIMVKQEIEDSVQVDHVASDWVDLVSLDTLNTDPGRPTILTEAEHDAAAAIVYSYFEAKADEILGL